jgi:hypothetical protein
LIQTWNISVNIGYNKILFNTTYDIPKGSIVYLDQTIDTGKIALSTLGNATYSDMKWGSDLISYYDTTIKGNLTNISGIKYVNYNFYLNSITTLEYYQNIFQFVHIYLDSFLYNLTVSPINSSVSPVFSTEVLIDRKYDFC